MKDTGTRPLDVLSISPSTNKMSTFTIFFAILLILGFPETSDGGISGLRDNTETDSHLNTTINGTSNNSSSSSIIWQDVPHHRPDAIIPQATIAVPLVAHSGTHHAQLYVGQPPQKQTLIVDTGSRLTAWTCQPCKNCGKHQADSYYDPRHSTTMLKIKCGECEWIDISSCSLTRTQCVISQRYAEGSTWQAYEVSDMVTLGLEGKSDYEEALTNALPFTFGCQTSVTGLFTEQYADGILGMEMSQYSIFHAMYREGIIDRPAFSLCLSYEGGYLGLGGALTHRHIHDESEEVGIGRHRNKVMRWTPNKANLASGSYAVHVKKVLLDDVCIACDGPHLQFFNNGKGTILDSGTTDTFLPVGIAGPLAKAWYELTGRDYNQRVGKYTISELERLPIISLVFTGNVTLQIPPENYMEGAQEWIKEYNALATIGRRHTPRELTNRIYADEPGGAVLGINAMLNYDILYTQEWLGFAPAQCRGQVDMPSSVS